jgi:hypothetical protein
VNLFIGEGDLKMNPVVGLNVSKGKSEVQAFLDKGNSEKASNSLLTEGY